MKEEHSTLLLRALGRRIRDLRGERGFSQEAFADQCGVHRTFMGTVERGESNLSFKNIAKIAATLNVSLSELFNNLETSAQILSTRGGVAAPAAGSEKTSKRKLTR